ncbi:MAG TPA: hydroxymethylbilane synthase [Stellaceae bacterium]|nr:hydroxymethylbilane synthase [Stellaceae bacterium]
MPARAFRIGTRGSPMALYQARLVRDRLLAAHPALAEPGALEIVPIRTTGDREQKRLLAEIGGKGLFTKEIEEALLDRRVDFAVHSLKDMETHLPDGLVIGCVLPRDDPRDAFLSRDGVRLMDLPRGARIGTASLRRAAQLLQLRPDLAIAPMRGNVGTRLDKLVAGETDGLVLALCGLERLGHVALVTEILDADRMLPAVAQGALAIECRSDDDEVKQILAPLHHADSAACVTAERALLAALDGSCRTPIAALARITGGQLALDAILLSPDGKSERRGSVSGAPTDADTLGANLGAELRRGAGPEFGLA